MHLVHKQAWGTRGGFPSVRHPCASIAATRRPLRTWATALPGAVCLRRRITGGSDVYKGRRLRDPTRTGRGAGGWPPRSPQCERPLRTWRPQGKLRGPVLVAQGQDLPRPG